MISGDPSTVQRDDILAWLPRRRTVFIALITVAVTCFVVPIALSIAQQRLALREIERFNGSAQFHPCAPDWFYSLIGRREMEWIDKPWHVVFWADEETMSRRSRFGGQTVLTEGPLIDDNNLNCVLGLPKLESLDLAFSNISDAGMRHVSQLKYLKELRLEGTDVSDQSIPTLQQIRSLKELNVEHTKITLEGGRELEALLPGCTVKGPHNDRWQLRLPPL